MAHKYREGQRVYCRTVGQYGVLTSGPRLRSSDFRASLNPRPDTKPIPSYDIRFDNKATDTRPETELETVSAHRWGAASAWAEKHKALLGLLVAIVAAVLTAAKLFRP